MKRLPVPLMILLLFITGCTSTPTTVTTEQDPIPVQGSGVKQPIESMDDNAVVVQFDSVAITKLTFKNTKTEIETVVEDLNKITLTKDYARWQTYLSDEYVAVFSDPENLAAVSRSLPTKGIQLRTLRDYFNYVFVPSRQNMRVDDIQFVSPIRVYVIMEIAPGSPAAIYILEKTQAGWKIVPKNQ